MEKKNLKIENHGFFSLTDNKSRRYLDCFCI